MVGAGNPLAAAEGLAVLRDGGNAVDAAIAAAAVLAVVSPHECGLGGDMLGLVYDAASGQMHALNASGCSPAAATLEQYRDGMPLAGARSVSVPGMVGGWAAAAQRFGTRPLDALLAGAIRYAEEGFLAYADLIDNAVERSASSLADPQCKALFFPQGRPLRPGELICQPAAAATLRAIAAAGADGFYRGPVAESMASYVRDNGGLLAAADLAGYEPLWQTPMEAGFEGYRVCSMPPNSWAAALLLQLMAMQRQGVAPSGDEVGFVLQGIRTRRLAYDLLEGCIADPDVAGGKAAAALEAFRSCPLSGIADIADTAASERNHGIDTSNVLVVDDAGNAVSLLQSVFVPFGSGLLDACTGVLFNNRMRGFSAETGDPNCVAPRKRPAQTLTPVLVMKDRQAWMACGTPGGPGQTGTMAQFIARVISRGEAIQDAIAAPRWSKTLAGDFILEDSAEARMREAVLQEEPAVKVAPWGSVNFGSVVAIMRDGDGWLGCADTRRNAAVHGF
jgi:gamma-glutamyltranspeptidase/glutathione hydrolase